MTQNVVSNLMAVLEFKQELESMRLGEQQANWAGNNMKMWELTKNCNEYPGSELKNVFPASLGLIKNMSLDDLFAIESDLNKVFRFQN